MNNDTRVRASLNDSLYEVLQVSRAASPEVIRAAYYVLARTYHPDVNPGAGAARRMLWINKAYAVLSDPVQRAQYDAQIAQAARGTRHRRPEVHTRTEESARPAAQARPEAPARPSERARANGRVPSGGRGRRDTSALRLESEPHRLGLSPLGRTVLVGLIMTIVVAVVIGLWAVLNALDDDMVRPSAVSDSIRPFAAPVSAPATGAHVPNSP